MEGKDCRQTNYPEDQTPCFKRAGSLPCTSPGCPVKETIEEKGITNADTIRLLLHSRCRISSLSQDNGEYIKRMVAQGERHLLSISE